MAGDNIILVGFMGSGKSVVGRLLARRLGRCFVETDDMITAEEGRPIAEIFAARGEAYFRGREAEALDLIKLKRGDVIATGGGLPCREGGMEALKALGTVIWLDGGFDTLYARATLPGGARPMLDDRPKTEVRALHESRIPYYRQAHLTVSTEGLGPDQVVTRIVALLARREPASR
ncbi:MAG: shikimate kinase [Candidatus Rokubacteria bacterium]|nr:shikimate kinase [Candidatus Rokubacteria bacterium]